MALSTAEMQQVRRALGYGNLLASARPYFDIQLIFEDVVQQNLDTTWAEQYIRNTILPEILGIEAQLQESRCRLKATAVPNQLIWDAEKEFRGLMAHNEYWRNELSLILRIPRADRPNGYGGFNVIVT